MFSPLASTARQYRETSAHQRRVRPPRCLYEEGNIPLDGLFEFIAGPRLPDVTVTEHITVPYDYDLQKNLIEIPATVSGHYVILYMMDGAIRTRPLGGWSSSHSVLQSRGYTEYGGYPQTIPDTAPLEVPAGYTSARQGVIIPTPDYATEAQAEGACGLYEFMHDGAAPILFGWIENTEIAPGGGLRTILRAESNHPNGVIGNPRFSIFRLHPGVGSILSVNHSAPSLDFAWAWTREEIGGAPAGYQRVRMSAGLRNNHPRFWWRVGGRGNFAGRVIETALLGNPSMQPFQAYAMTVFELDVFHHFTAYPFNDQRIAAYHETGPVLFQATEDGAVIKTFSFSFLPTFKVPVLNHTVTYDPGDGIIRDFYRGRLTDQGAVPPLTNATLEINVAASVGIASPQFPFGSAPYTSENIFVPASPDSADFQFGVHKTQDSGCSVALDVWQNQVAYRLNLPV